MIKTEWAILALAVASVSTLIVVWLRKKEKFTIHEVDTPTCIPSTASLPPNSDKMNVVLQPNTVRLAIQGYNYQDTPVFFRDGKKIVPMEFAWDSDTLTYFFTLATPNGLCNHDWILETYDFVEPIIIDQDSYKPLKVLAVRRRRGFNRWQLLCE